VGRGKGQLARKGHREDVGCRKKRIGRSAGWGKGKCTCKGLRFKKAEEVKNVPLTRKKGWSGNGGGRKSTAVTAFKKRDKMIIRRTPGRGEGSLNLKGS